MTSGPIAEARSPTTFRCEAARIDGQLRTNVDITCAAGIITSIGSSESVHPPAGGSVQHLPGLVLPGFADAHSHIFHRGLRGRTHDGTGTFWTWRDRMYELAGRLTPDSLRELAFAGYLEMLCAGYTAVGEFHYLHHPPGGGRYDDPNAMGLTVAQAADDAGIGLTLLDIAYLAGGFGVPVSPVQQRFSDGTADAWAAPHTRCMEISAATRRANRLQKWRNAIRPPDTIVFVYD